MNIPYLSLEKVTAQHAEEIQDAVACVVSKGWYLQGEETRAFEQEYAEYVGAKNCISCANGLDALTLILRGYKELGMLKDGDEVIVPANTYIASILAISENNLTPVLVEPKLSNYQIDDSLIEKAITSRTRAIMIVHLYGFDAYTEKIGNICKANNLLLIQDCAQAHGILHTKINPASSRIGACAYSFYPGKNLGALGDAGCITTNETELAEVVRTLANYGSSRKYIFEYKGRNSRMDEIQAAVLRVKLKYLDEENKRRKEIAKRYIAEIKNRILTLPPLDGVYHVFPVLCKDRDSLQQYLLSKGIHTMIHYPIPPHQQKAYSEWNNLSYPITEKIHREELSIPCNQTMTDDEVNYIIHVLQDFQGTK